MFLLDEISLLTPKLTQLILFGQDIGNQPANPEIRMVDKMSDRIEVFIVHV